jgi:hypothetical protein
MITKAKIDSNHAQIVKDLKCIPGVSVHSVAQLKRFCDIVVGFRGKNYLFEIKKNKKSKLTDGEKVFSDHWTGQINVITCTSDALYIMGILLKDRES